jgi:hypothetical protein
MHPPGITGAALLVRGTLLGSPGDTIRFSKDSYAVPVTQVNGSWKSGDRSTSFFPSGIYLPKPGDWLLIATSGDDWGCFILHAL